MRPAVFLDRDGTLLKFVDHLIDPAQVELSPGAVVALQRLRNSGHAIIVITNQPLIGRGLATPDQVAQVNEEMNRKLRALGSSIDAVYVCPVAPTGNDPTIIEHVDRKPGPGLLMRAAVDHGIQLDRSWMVGDSVRDVLAGRNARCFGQVLLTNGKPIRNEEIQRISPVLTAPNLCGAVDLILRVKLKA